MQVYAYAMRQDAPMVGSREGFLLLLDFLRKGSRVRCGSCVRLISEEIERCLRGTW